MACILRENVPSEVAAFRADVWQGESIYLDHKFQFYHALGGGKPFEMTIEEFQATRTSPTPVDETNNAKAKSLAEGYMTPEHHNLVGQGLMTGGVYVVRLGGAVEWTHHESFVGDTADPADIIEAATRASVPSKI